MPALLTVEHADSFQFGKFSCSTIHTLMDCCGKSYVDFIGDEGLITQNYAFRCNRTQSYLWNVGLSSSYIWRR